MLWTEVRKWAKNQGFETIKEKDDSVNGASYYWMKNSDPAISGVSPSVSKLARDIFNAITNNVWVDHQKEYSDKKDNPQFSVSNY